MDSIKVTGDHIVSIYEEDHDYTWTQPYITAMVRNDWKGFKKCLHGHQSDLSRRVNKDEETFLHVAIRIQNSFFVFQLVKLMNTEDLIVLKDKDGYTALSLVAINGTKDMAKALVEKNTSFVSVRTKVISDHEEQPGDVCDAANQNKIRKQHVELPVVTAARNRNNDVVCYLYWETDKNEFSQDNGKDGATLLTRLIASNLFDIASDLLQKLPNLAITDDNYGKNVVSMLVRNPSAFPSGRRHDERWHLLETFFGISNWISKSEKHSLEVLEIVSTQVSKMDEKQLNAAGIVEAVFEATKFGIVEFVYKLLKCNSLLENCKDEVGKNFLMYAIIYRQEKVFELIQHTRNKKIPLSYIGKKDGNNILHEAALLDNLSKIHKIHGAHLQMQHELQWFEEVEKLVPPEFRDELNHQGLTPRGLFTEQHRPLMEKGEKWLKDTSNACTIIATLIATVMLGAAYAIPGGVDNNGHPVFLTSDLFLFFILMDSVSLFASSCSMLMFVGITISRYTEKDFHRWRLPTKLIVALTTLFFSIGTMMAAFCATLFIVLRGRNKWVPIAGSAIAFPVSQILVLHFIYMFRMTYGNVFKNSNDCLHGHVPIVFQKSNFCKSLNCNK